MLEAGDTRQVDHINHDGIDNRKSNLRICSSNQNKMNRRPNRNKIAKYKGLCLNKKTGKWIVRISVNGKRLYLGTFKNEATAASKYNEAAIKYHGEFAKLNEI